MPKSPPLQRALSLLLILHKLPHLLLLITVSSSTIPTARCWSLSQPSFHHHNPNSNRWISFTTEPSRTIDIARPSSYTTAAHIRRCRMSHQLSSNIVSMCLSPKETIIMPDDNDDDDNNEIHGTTTTTIDRRNWMLRSTATATAILLIAGSSNAQPTLAVPTTTTTTPIAHSTTATTEEEEDPLAAFGRSLSSVSAPPSTATSGGGVGGKTTTAVEFRLGLEGSLGSSNGVGDGGGGGAGSGGKSLEEAVRDAERRRRVDPRTHG